MTALVIAEHDHASIKPATLNTVTAALACGGDVHILVAGANAAEAAKAAAQIAGVSKVIAADSASLAENLAENVAAQVLAIAPGGVDWLFTAHSEGQLEAYAQIVRPFGQITAIDDGPRDVSPLKPRSITWHWELMFTRPVQQTPDMIEQHLLLERVADMVEQGQLVSTATRRMTPISAATLREAHQLVEGGRLVGKLVLRGWE